jgi:hypothetical protein
LKTLIEAGRLDDELRWRTEAGVPVRL